MQGIHASQRHQASWRRCSWAPGHACTAYAPLMTACISVLLASSPKSRRRTPSKHLLMCGCTAWRPWAVGALGIRFRRLAQYSICSNKGKVDPWHAAERGACKKWPKPAPARSLSVPRSPAARRLTGSRTLGTRCASSPGSPPGSWRWPPASQATWKGTQPDLHVNEGRAPSSRLDPGFVQAEIK